jgi:hypothetical protein
MDPEVEPVTPRVDWVGSWVGGLVNGLGTLYTENRERERTPKTISLIHGK